MYNYPGECDHCTIMGCPDRKQYYYEWDNHDRIRDHELRDHDLYDLSGLSKNNQRIRDYKKCKEEREAGIKETHPRTKPVFEVKLRYWTNCIDITHPVIYYERDAFDIREAERLAYQKFPQLKPESLEITAYYGD